MLTASSHGEGEGGADDLVWGGGQDLSQWAPVLVPQEGHEEAREGGVKQSTQEEVDGGGLELQGKLEHRLSERAAELRSERNRLIDRLVCTYTQWKLNFWTEHSPNSISGWFL